MAASISRDAHIKQLSGIVECSICYETFSDPRQLPCFHTYCLRCIRQFSRDKLPGDDVACPLCRKEFIIPQDGVAGLPKNCFVEQFVEQLSELKGELSTHCEVCSTSETEAAVRKTATMFCMDCSERLCETCANTHRRMKVSREHELVKQDGGNESSETRVRVARIYCDKHREKVLELYCFDCKSAICMMCFVKSHKPHECSDINEVADEFRTEMTGDIKNMIDTVARCREVIKKEEMNNKKFNSTVKQIEREICNRADKLKELIEKDKLSLLKELEIFKDERNKQVNNVVGEIEQHVSFVESLRTYTELLREKGRSGDVTQQKNTIQDRADELMKMDEIQIAVTELGSVDVSLTAATWSVSSEDILGKISKKRSDGKSIADALLVKTPSSRVQRPLRTTVQPVDESSGVVVQCVSTTSELRIPQHTADNSAGTVNPGVSTTSQVGQSQQLTSKPVADISSSAVVQRVPTSQVQQTTAKRNADKSPGAVVQRVPTSQIQQTTAKRNAVSHVISSGRRGAVDGVAIYSDKLFVSRERSKERIQQFDVKTFQEEKFIEVKGLRDVGGWWYKSMTSCDINSCLYIADYYKVFRVNPSTKDVISWPVDGSPCGLSVNETRNVLVTCYGDDTIKEYSTDGSFVRSIKLQVNHVMSPLHCIQLTDSRYVVCHQSPVPGVSEIDKHGTLNATYRNSETTELKMNWPRCVILFNDSLLVADTWNDRILLLNTSLRDARPLSLPVNSQLRRPCCMYLEQSRGRLFVGEESGRVLVIDNIDLK